MAGPDSQPPSRAAARAHIARYAQQRQLAEHSFELLECRDLNGQPVRCGGDAASSSELHYMRRRFT